MMVKKMKKESKMYKFSKIEKFIDLKVLIIKMTLDMADTRKDIQMLSLTGSKTPIIIIKNHK
jgi:hypothetical protein